MKLLSEADRIRIGFRYPEKIPYIGSTHRPIWVDAARQEHLVMSMEKSHIANALKCLCGHSETKIPEYYKGFTDSWIKLFKNELAAREDGEASPKYYRVFANPRTWIMKSDLSILETDYEDSGFDDKHPNTFLT